MRCKNCGWPNKPQTKVCVKCHAPLDQSEMSESISQPDYSSNETSNSGLKDTVMESETFGNDFRYENRECSENNIGQENNICSKCGYLLRPGASKCPNCNFPVNIVSREPEVQRQNISGNNSSGRATRLDNQGGTNAKFRGTVNPYMMNYEPDPTFILKPLKRMNERKDFEDVEYEGSNVILTRDNTEASNPSITSKEQAVISRVDGHWYIEDCSEQKTTFIRVGNKLQLHDGDIILLGNRLFEFHE